MYTVTTAIQRGTGECRQYNQARKGNKMHPDCNVKSETVVICRQDDHIGNPVEFAKISLVKLYSIRSIYKIQLYFYILSENNWKCKKHLKDHLLLH